jgi:hypothetical protein
MGMFAALPLVVALMAPQDRAAAVQPMLSDREAAAAAEAAAEAPEAESPSFAALESDRCLQATNARALLDRQRERIALAIDLIEIDVEMRGSSARLELAVDVLAQYNDLRLALYHVQYWVLDACE